MDRFIGRKAELKTLHTAFSSAKSEFIPIYGRRRVGKSELITHFIQKKNGLYFLGKRTPALLQISDFMSSAAQLLGKPWLAEIPFENWKSALKRVVSEWDSKNKKLIIALDEFQWMCQSSPELPSVIQELWDREWKKAGNIFLILCGSYIGFMEREVLGRKSPLFGRRTGQIQLQPFSYLESAQFHPNWSIENQAVVWFICGGIPYYLEFFDKNLSIETNIVRHILDEHSALFREPDFLLREELRELPKYNGILTAIGNGMHRLPQIAKKTGIEEKSLGYYLQQLINIGYISKKYPLTTSKPSPRSVHYVLDDPLLRFWFRFVNQNTGAITYLGKEKVFASSIKPMLPSYFGLCFEYLCKSALPYIYVSEGVISPFEIGAFWNSNTQIDVVGIRDDHWIDLCECKWTPGVSIKQIEKSLRDRCTNFPNPQNYTIKPRLFLKKAKKVQSTPSDITIHTLEELYQLARA